MVGKSASVRFIRSSFSSSFVTFAEKVRHTLKVERATLPTNISLDSCIQLLARRTIFIFPSKRYPPRNGEIKIGDEGTNNNFPSRNGVDA